MTASVATVVEEERSPLLSRPGIYNLIREVALVSALSSTQVSATDFTSPRPPVWSETTIGTTDEALLFEVAPESLSALHDVETLSAALSRWIRDLDEICEEAATENWDGEGAVPVQPGARGYAIALATELAPGTRFPEVAVDPDGEISLGWHVGSDVFSVSISGTGRLSYAGLFGASDCHGTEWMVARVPFEIARQLDRFLLAIRAPGQPD